jgi:hypothetical protein
MARRRTEVGDARYDNQEGGGWYISQRRNGPEISRRRQARVDALWIDEPGGKLKEPTRRDYETVGYAISGNARLDLE